MFTPEQDLIDYTAHALRIYMAGSAIFGIQLACQMTFVAIGNAKASITVAVIRKFLLLLPLIYIMPSVMEDKAIAVFTAEPIADLLAVTCTAILFSVVFARTVRKLQHNTPDGDDAVLPHA